MSVRHCGQIDDANRMTGWYLSTGGPVHWIDRSLNCSQQMAENPLEILGDPIHPRATVLDWIPDGCQQNQEVWCKPSPRAKVGLGRYGSPQGT